jgi:hypothetical protein
MLFMIVIEIAFIAARVFRQERIWKTWSSLSMLPMSTRRIAYHKIIGCLIAVWPAALLGALGAALVADDLGRSLKQIFDLSRPDRFQWMELSGFAFAILLVAFFLHLVATLSLRLKWGALPLAFAITYVGAAMSVGMAFLMFKEAAFLVLDFVLITVTGSLHYHIGNRLETLAAED